jgi:hypothetical protein
MRTGIEKKKHDNCVLDLSGERKEKKNKQPPATI